MKLNDYCLNITDGKHGDCVPEDHSGFFFISAKDISDGCVHYDDAREITKIDFCQTNKRTKLENGDILITNSGSIGNTVFVNENNCKLGVTTFQKSVAIIKPNTKKVDPYFLYVFLSSRKKHFQLISNSSVQKNLLLDTLREYDVSFPSTDFQIIISNFVKNIDEMIETNREKIKILKKKVNDLFVKAFFEFDFSLLGIDEKVELVDGKYQAIPSSYKESPFTSSSLFKQVSVGIEPFSGTKIYLSTSDVIGDIINNDACTIDYSNRESRANMQPVINSIWFARMKNSNKHIYFRDSGIDDYILSTGFTGVIPNDGYFDFLFALINTKWFEKVKNLNSTGSTQQSITDGNLSNVWIIEPPKKLILAFNKIVNCDVDLIIQLLNENYNLSAYKDFIIPFLLSKYKN